MAPIPDAVFLRFRDLVTAPGDTIAQHADIAKASEGVWWGWWNKSGERVASETFRLICDHLTEVSFFLFDSGHIALWRASCAEIQWHTSGKPMPSPDLGRTPDYYKDQRYRMWFRLSAFERIEQSEPILRSFSYLQVNEFFENSSSSYTPFYDKRIHNLDELKQQDRTIWFARRYKDGDPIHEVSLLGRHRITPANFTQDFEGSKSANMLWISDLHCGGHHAFPNKSGPHQKTLAVELEKAAKRHEIEDFAAIIVYGDLTWSGDDNEFHAAREVLHDLARTPSTLDNYRLAICPGNHDLRFSQSPQDKTAPVTEAGTEARRAYERFYKELFYVAPNAFLSMGRRFLLGQSAPVEIVCLNSSFLQQSNGWFQGHGYVGSDQLADAVTTYGWNTNSGVPRPFRIVVLHHHLFPTAWSEEPQGDRSYSVTLDAERVVRELMRYRVDLVLHGHMHNNSCTRIRRPVEVDRPDGEWHELTVIGLGSAGVNMQHRDSSSPNMFGVLTAKDSEVLVRVFSVHPSDAESKQLFELAVPRTRAAK